MKKPDDHSEDMRASRREHWQVKITPCNYPLFENELNLSITHNGYQWQSMQFSPEEARAMLKALQQYLDGLL